MINIPALTRLRDYMVEHQDLNLYMRAFINKYEQKDDHFCTTSACLAGWGAMKRLEADHPILAPLYSIMDKSAKMEHIQNQYPCVMTITSRAYSDLIVNTPESLPQYQEKLESINNIASTIQSTEYHTISELSDHLDVLWDNHESSYPQSYEDMMIWEFIFGANNPNDINHAIHRMNYVIKHNTIPAFYSLHNTDTSTFTLEHANEIYAKHDVELPRHIFPSSHYYDPDTYINRWIYDKDVAKDIRNKMKELGDIK